MNSIHVRTTAAFRGRLAVLAAVLALLALATPRSSEAQGQISGSGISRVGKDTRKLTASAQAQAGSSAATGVLQFIHNSPGGLSRFRGTVSCLTVNGGVVQLSGLIDKGETATGTLLDGKAFAFTIQTGTAQAFSLPSFGDPGSLGACSGGQSSTVPVTEAGFTTQQ